MLLMGDSHTGSIYAPSTSQWWFDPEYRPYDEQKFANWCSVMDQIQGIKKKVNLAFFNGDLIDGPNVPSVGDNVWSTNIDDQIQEFIKLAKMIKYNECMINTGSNFHVRTGATPYETTIAREIGALHAPSRYGDRYGNTGSRNAGTVYTRDNLGRLVVYKEEPKNGKDKKKADKAGTIDVVEKYHTRLGNYADVSRIFKIDGTQYNISITHHVSYSKIPQYRPTGLAREMMLWELDTPKNLANGERIAFFLRNHTHYYVQVRYAYGWGAICGAWKQPDPYLLRHGEGGTATTEGAIYILMEPNGERHMEPLLVPTDHYPKRPIEIVRC